MHKNAKVTVFEVALASAVLRVVGDPITVKAVRTHVGGGSNRDVSRILNEIGYSADVRHQISDELCNPYRRRLPSWIIARIAAAIERIQALGSELTVERVRIEAHVSPCDAHRVLKSMRGPKARPAVRRKHRRTLTDLPIVIDPIDDPDLGSVTNPPSAGSQPQQPWVSAVDTRREEDTLPSPQVSAEKDCTATNNPGQDSVCDPEDSPLRSARHPGGDPAARHSGSNERRPGTRT